MSLDVKIGGRELVVEIRGLARPLVDEVDLEELAGVAVSVKVRVSRRGVARHSEVLPLARPSASS